MCEFKSAIVLQNGDVVHSPCTDSHEDLVRLAGGPRDNGRAFVRVELLPAGDWISDPWALHVDEPCPPDWWDQVLLERTERFLRDVVAQSIVRDRRDILAGGAWLFAPGAGVNKLIGGRIIFAVQANLSGANLSGANLSGVILSGANLSGANLSGANLSGANLSGANLSGANLSGADLSRANLSRANLSGADLSRANLSRAILSGADLSRANLSRAILSGTNLSGADLWGANLSGANLSRANLSGANLSEAIGLPSQT